MHSDGPKGMMAETMRAGAMAMMGAHMKRNLCALLGTKSSLKRNFTASAMKCVIPHSRVSSPNGKGMLARLGPSRSCIMADCRRSSHVRIEASGMRKPSIMKRIFTSAATMMNPSEP